MNKYVLVTWPDSQELMEQEWFQDCILLNDDESLESFGSSAYLVPEDKYEELYPTNKGDISDGYHTFNELYEFRKMYNAALFNEWAKNPLFLHNDLNKEFPVVKYNVHKSWKHHDGELCFGGGWFIVSAMLPTGQISNHYKAEDWDLFKIPEVEKALFEFDGHTGKDVLERLKNL